MCRQVLEDWQEFKFIAAAQRNLERLSVNELFEKAQDSNRIFCLVWVSNRKGKVVP